MDSYFLGAPNYTYELLRCKDERVVFHDVHEAPFAIHGLYQPKTEKTFHRLPEDVAAATSQGVFDLQRNTAGGRIRFRTDSDVIAIRTGVPYSKIVSHITPLAGFGLDMYVTHPNGKSVFCHAFKPACDRFCGYEGVYTFPEHQMHEITLNMPLHNDIHSLEVGILPDAQLLPPSPYAIEKPVIFYGSSITHGACASRPGLTYEAQISRRLDCDYYNFGFSGQCKGEPAIVNYMASLPCSAFVCDYDHNAPTAEHLRNTHLPIYRAVRAAQPDIPILFVSRPNYNPHSADDRERRAIIMHTYETAWNEGDRKVYFVDGATLFGTEDREDCTTDGCHPNDLGFYRMAQHIGAVLKYALHLD